MRHHTNLLAAIELAPTPVPMVACVAMAGASIPLPPAPDSIVSKWDPLHFLVDDGASSSG
jgi:hypothetical protein